MKEILKKALLFGSGGNFENYIWQHVNVGKWEQWLESRSKAWKSTNKLLVIQIVKISTTIEQKRFFHYFFHDWEPVKVTS